MTKKNIIRLFISVILIVAFLLNLPTLIYTRYFKIFTMYMAYNNYIKAEQTIKKSFVICNKFFGENNICTIKSMEDLGEVYFRYGDYNKAHQYLEKAYKVRQKNSQLYNDDTVGLFDNLGELYAFERNYKESKNFFETTLEINNKIHGETSNDSLASLLNIAQICICENDLAEAHKILNQIEKFPAEAQTSQAPLYYGIVSVKGQYFQALKDYKKVENIYKQAINNKNIPIKYSNRYKARIIEDLGVLYKSQNKNQQAEKTFIYAIQLREKQEKCCKYLNEQNLAMSLLNLALVQKNQNKFQNAKRNLNKAITIQSRHLSSSYPETVCAYYFLGNNKKVRELQKMSSLYLKSKSFRENIDSYCNVRVNER